MNTMATPNTDSGSAYDSWAHVMEVAQELFAQTTLEATLDTTATFGCQLLGCDAAAILLGSEKSGTTAAAASHPDARRADALQLEARQGPGLQAMARRQPVISTELRFDSRWRFWAPQAAHLGFRSVLSLGLADGDTTGALNLYSRRASFFHSHDLALGQMFARHASIALAIAAEREQLLRAVDSRGVVGQAQGILMERYNVTADQAFTVLGRYSSHLNLKLRLVAELVIRDRSLPDVHRGEDALGIGEPAETSSRRPEVLVATAQSSSRT
jgi:transcriptional regulator with GAF, ATPase, and Fis domain